MPLSFLSAKKRHSDSKSDQFSGSSSEAAVPIDGKNNWSENKAKGFHSLPLPKINTRSGRTSSEISSLSEASPSSLTASDRGVLGRNEYGGDFNRLHRRTLSDKVRTTPSSLVRRSRIYSGALEDNANISTTSINRRTVSLRQRLLNDNLPPELSPVVSLITAQKLRVYATGTFMVPGRLGQGNEKVWIEVEAKLTGNELAIWRSSTEEYSVDGNDELKPKYINLVDSTFELGEDNVIKIYHDFQEQHSIMIKFNSNVELVKWLAAMTLAQFEYTSLNEAYTAVMLSLKGSKLADLHILLTPKKRFPKYEWCDLRLPQISSKWLRVYVACFPSDAKKTGRIEIYTNDKMNKKNLILYVPKLTNIYNVYPESSTMIDFNSIMKMNGDIFINRQYEYLFHHTDNGTASPKRTRSFKSHSRTGSDSSLTSFHGALPSPHSRSVSVNSTSSFFNNATSASMKNDSASPKQMNYIKKHMNNYVNTNYLYLMPLTHPGVTPIETMLRNFIYCLDAFKLYGRPEKLDSDKSSIKSLLFGLPSLPHFEYLSLADAEALVNANIETSVFEDWTMRNWMNLFKSAIAEKQKSGFAGSGDIARLYHNLEDSYEAMYSSNTPTPDNGMQSPTEPLSHGFDSSSNNASSSLSGEHDIGDTPLGEPIDLGDNYTPGMTKSFNNLKLNELVSTPLEPIVDLPTPRDESHPYASLLSRKVVSTGENPNIEVNYI